MENENKRNREDGAPGDDGQDQVENKRKRGGEFELRLLISSKMSGAVIGKKGQSCRSKYLEFFGMKSWPKTTFCEMVNL